MSSCEDTVGADTFGVHLEKVVCYQLYYCGAADSRHAQGYALSRSGPESR